MACILIVFHIVILFQWKRHKEKKTVIVNQLKTNETLSIGFVAMFALAIYYVVLYFLGTDMPFLNAVPTVIYLLGNYFAFRRSDLQFWCYLSYQVFAGALWIISACDGQLGSIIFLIGFISEFVYNLFGIVNWKKIKTSQRDPVETMLKIIKDKW